MIATQLKNALTGAVVGAIGGPIIGGLSGFLILSAVWLIQGLIQQWPAEELRASLAWASVFGVLVAPLSVSAGVIVGGVIGAFGRWFGSLVNAGSFGGLVGSIIGIIAGLSLFGRGGGELSPVIVAFVAVTITGVAVALAVKKLQWRLSRSQP